MKNTNKGVIMLVALMVMTVLSLILPAYVLWSMWDQKNIFRQQNIQLADSLAQAGLNRAILDLSLTSESWLAGKINSTTVTSPNSGDPNAFYALYSDPATFAPDPISYSVEIRYLYDTTNSRFFDKRMWVRSTGNAYGSSRVLSELVNGYVVKNLTRNALYTSLAPALAQAKNLSWDNDNIAMMDSSLSEDITINSGLRYNIYGCYDPNFSYRECGNFHTVIQGNMSIQGSSDVHLSGVTIQ